MKLRRATAADLPTLKRWDEAPHVIAASGNDEGFDWEAEISPEYFWQETLIAAVDDRPIGVVVILQPDIEPTRYWGDCGPGLRAIDIWIGEADCLGKGYGEQMMREAFARCFAAPDVTAILIDPLQSNVRARKFYARLGFHDVGPRRFGDDDCMVMRLERADWSAAS